MKLTKKQLAARMEAEDREWETRAWRPNIVAWYGHNTKSVYVCVRGQRGLSESDFIEITW